MLRSRDLRRNEPDPPQSRTPVEVPPTPSAFWNLAPRVWWDLRKLPSCPSHRESPIPRCLRTGCSLLLLPKVPRPETWTHLPFYLLGVRCLLHVTSFVYRLPLSPARLGNSSRARLLPNLSPQPLPQHRPPLSSEYMNANLSFPTSS